MSSFFADRFNDTARPLLWRLHGEWVLYRDGDDNERDLRVIWKRINPTVEDSEGFGVDSFHAEAQAVVRIADLPDPDGQGLLIRKDETWAIRLVELQDEWTWILHLAHPREDLRLPERIR